MKMRNLSIRNFRGIKKLDWTLDKEDNLICLIGHGDSTKSTILKAIEYTLTSKWNLPLVDSDFYNCDPENEIEIEITIGNLPNDLLKQFHANYRYFKDGEFRNLEDKRTDDELVITVLLKINCELDPFWGICDSEGNIDEEDRLLPSTRKVFNLVRLDKESKNTFNWKYDSPLLKFLNKKKKQEIKTSLAIMGRVVRDKFDKTKLPKELQIQAKEIEDIAKILAVGHENFNANVDIFSADTICLHRGTIPLYMLGEGSKKIASLAIGKYLIKKSKEEDSDGGFIIFDEIENSLEPHRLRFIASSFMKDSNDSKFQTFLTTHSSITVEELGTKGLYVVRNNNGEISIHKITSDCIAAVRRNAECLFAKKIVICEGKTEFGLLKAFNRHWSKQDQQKIPLQHRGTVLLDGEGSNMKRYIKKFNQMGYELCVYKDNDTDDPKLSNLAKELDIPVFEYPDGYRTEKIVFAESPKKLQNGIVDFFNVNKAEKEDSIKKTENYDQSMVSEIESKLHDSQHKDDLKPGGMFRNVD